MLLKGASRFAFSMLVFIGVTGYAIAQSPETFYTRGMQAARRGDYAQAVADLQRAVDLQPDFAKAHAGLGTIYLHLGAFDASVAALQRALSIKPGLLQAEANLAAVYTLSLIHI